MLIEAVYLKYNYDFRDYTGASQKRRVLAALRAMECETVSELQAKVMHEPCRLRPAAAVFDHPGDGNVPRPEYYLASAARSCRS
jgi:chemotaxis protein methyltransferase CheR